MTPRTSLIVEPNVGSHQAEYLLWIARAWRDASPAGRQLVVRAPPDVLTRRPELGHIAAMGAITLDPIPERSRAGTSLSNALARGRWDALAAAADHHRADRVLIQSLDHVLAPLASRRPIQARLGGILFRPTLHYATLGSPPVGLVGWTRTAAKTAITRVALRHPALTDVFSLDPSAVPSLARLARGRVHALPDPVSPEVPSETGQAVRARYGIDDGRALVAMAGTLDDRKGVRLLLRALAALDPETAARTAVVLAGRVAVADRAALDREVARARAGSLQVVFHEGYLSSEDLAALIAAADRLVLPYDHHVGSSGFLIRAAAAGTPVVAQSYGWIGHAVRTHRLGWTADPADALAFAAALTASLTGPSPEGDPSFVAAHTVEAFAAPLLSFLTS